MWSPQGCVAIETPCEATFLIQSLKWTPNGSAIILVGKDHYCVAYFQQVEKNVDVNTENEKENGNIGDSSDTENSDSV
jgi:hypothetical protein